MYRYGIFYYVHHKYTVLYYYVNIPPIGKSVALNLYCIRPTSRHYLHCYNTSLYNVKLTKAKTKLRYILLLFETADTLGICRAKTRFLVSRRIVICYTVRHARDVVILSTIAIHVYILCICIYIILNLYIAATAHSSLTTRRLAAVDLDPVRLSHLRRSVGFFVCRR